MLTLTGCFGRGRTTASSAPSTAVPTVAVSLTGTILSPTSAPSVPAAAPTVPRAAPRAAPRAGTSPGAIITVPLVTVAPRTLPTPEAASRNLWDAWRDDDRPRALLAANADAVRALFAQPWGPEVLDQGCAPMSATAVRCGYALDTTAKLVTVEGSVAAGFRVTRVDSGAPLVADDLTRAGIRVGASSSVPSTAAPISAPGAGVTTTGALGAPSAPAASGVPAVAGSPALAASTDTSVNAAPTVPGAPLSGARRTRRKVVAKPPTAKARIGATGGRSGKPVGAVGAVPAGPPTPVAAGPNTTPSGRVVVHQPVTQVKDGNNP